MPNHKSRTKNVNTSEKARVANRSVRSSIRTSLKVVRAAQSKEELLQEMPRLFSMLDKASSNGRAGFTANRAANYKSKVAQLLNQFEASPSAEA